MRKADEAACFAALSIFYEMSGLTVRLFFVLSMPDSLAKIRKMLYNNKECGCPLMTAAYLTSNSLSKGSFYHGWTE